jgi:hypothetical protein
VPEHDKQKGIEIKKRKELYTFIIHEKVQCKIFNKKLSIVLHCLTIKCV